MAAPEAPFPKLSNLEKIINEGKIFAIIPLAKWHLSIPKKPDYNNAYLWLSVASAFNIKNSDKARNIIFNKIKLCRVLFFNFIN